MGTVRVWLTGICTCMSGWMVLLVYGRLGYVHVCEGGWVLLGYGRLGYVHVCQDG